MLMSATPTWVPKERKIHEYHFNIAKDIKMKSPSLEPLSLKKSNGGTRPQIEHRPVIKNNLENKTPAGKHKSRGNPAWKKGVVTNPKGRPKGAKNKMPSMLRMAIESGELPLAFMLRMMRSRKNSLEFRLQAASSAAPYVHRKMPIGVEQIPGRFGSLTADQLRQLPTSALQQLLQASREFYQQLVQLGVTQPQGEVIDVTPS